MAGASSHDRRVGRQRLLDRLVDVALAERLRRRRENGDLGHARLVRRGEAASVGHQRGVASPRSPRDSACDVARIAHLRHARGIDEGRDLDHRQPGRSQRVDKRNLCRGRNLRGFVLQAVAGAHLDDGHARWQRERRSRQRHQRDARLHQVADLAGDRRDTPSTGALSGSSIFMASSTIRVSPRATRSPGVTAMARTVAGIGADRLPVASRLRARAGRSVSATSGRYTTPSMPDPRRLAGAGGKHTVRDAVDDHAPLPVAHRLDTQYRRAWHLQRAVGER